jgi:ribosomal protein S18 acetylase RimI-like enzyme
VRWGEDWIEERIAQVPANAAVAVQHFMRSTDTAGRRLLESHGYAPIRTHYVAAVDLAQPPAPAEWPVGIGVRTFVPGEDDEVLFQAGEEAMSDQANRPPSTRERWLAPTTTAGFDPSLWWLAAEESSGEVAGVCLCSFVSGTGHVNGVGVRRAWRRRGLGLALLLNALGELRRRGAAEARLSVDSDSPTGAPRVYTRAGMHVARSYVRYSKDLRPAAEPAAAAERS